jgi:hypothetical protein
MSCSVCKETQQVEGGKPLSYAAYTEAQSHQKYTTNSTQLALMLLQ